MMKKIYLFFAILVLTGACTSSKKYLQRGQYDLAIEKSVKKLIKNPDKAGELDILRRAYDLANNKDKEAIDELHYSGQPDIWESIYHHYDNMRYRQELVERLPSKVLRKMGHQHIDYAKSSAEAKKKAARFLYAHAGALLKNNNRQDARKAYDELTRLQQFYPNYPNTRALKDKAYFLGTNKVLFVIRNQSQKVMPKGFEYELKKITLKSLNQRFLDFDTRESQDVFYDYTIYLTLKEIEVSPEKLKEIHYDEDKRVRDGFQYVLDENGNVKKDSLGNDVKVPKYKVIKAHVIENRMEKSAVVSGTIDFYDNRNNQLIKTFPLSVRKDFLYRYGTYSGNRNALKKETLKIIGLQPVPFPSDLQIIYDTNEDIKKVAMDVIRANRRLLRD